ncbi:MAG: hypothetical protein AAF581_15965 [Planctomycetota bacterium]
MRLLLLCLAVPLLNGCATIVTGTRKSVNFVTEPAGATITVQEKQIVSPASVELRRGRTVTATVSLDGYEDVQFEMKKNFQGWFLGNILIGGLVGMIIDLGSGAYQTFDDIVHINMATGEVKFDPGKAEREARRREKRKREEERIYRDFSG